MLAPDEVLPGTQKQRASIRPLPQIFESLETLVELSPQAESEVKLRTTATGTVISIPPDVPEVPSVKTDDLSNRRPSLQPVPPDTLTSPPEPAVPSSKQLIVNQIYPSENENTYIKTDLLDPEIFEEQSVSATPQPQTNVPPLTRTSATKALELQLSSTEDDVLVELPLPKQPPESLLAPEIKSEIPKALEGQPEVATKVLRSSQSSKGARSSKDPEVLAHGASPPELSTIFAKSEIQPDPEKAKLTSVIASEQIPSTSKAAADMSEAQVIMSEPYEVPYTGSMIYSTSLTVFTINNNNNLFILTFKTEIRQYHYFIFQFLSYSLMLNG